LVILTVIAIIMAGSYLQQRNKTRDAAAAARAAELMKKK
jgi:uncharacterized protein (UPF0333 family)